MKSTNPAAFLPLLFMTITACTIVPPKISLTGEKTVIERQIIGDYRELESDAWVISSVKTPPREKGIQVISGTDPELMGAIKIRQFHSEKIARYKAQGAIGEAGTGLLAYRPVDLYESKKNEKDVLLTVIRNENEARLTIFRRSLYLRGNKESTEEDVSQFGRTVFAGEQRNAALKGEWIQDAGEKWIQK
jgi:hypothetical protein